MLLTNRKIISDGKDAWKRERSYGNCWWERQHHTHTREDDLAVSNKVKPTLTIWNSSPNPRYYTRKMIIYVHSETSKGKFKAALYIIIKNFQQLVVSEWIK